MDILSFLHVNDNRTNVPHVQPGHDPIDKIRLLVNHLNERFKVPDRDTCADEAMRPFKGSPRFRAYMKDKPTKWGFKFYDLCESSTGYVYNFEIFCVDRSLSNKPIHVVMSLTRLLLNSGYNLYIDNYYCCPQLAEYLITAGSVVCGAVKSNRVGLPKDLSHG